MLSFQAVALQHAENEEREGIVGLIRETVDGLRDLIADHIKLARLELVADAKTYGRSVAVLVVAGLVLAIGYIFGLVAAALGLARIGAPRWRSARWQRCTWSWAASPSAGRSGR